LKSVRRAIEAIEMNGQESSLEVGNNRRGIVRANLLNLYKEEKYLLRQIDRSEGAGITFGVPT